MELAPLAASVLTLNVPALIVTPPVNVFMPVRVSTPVPILFSAVLPSTPP